MTEAQHGQAHEATSRAATGRGRGDFRVHSSGCSSEIGWLPVPEVVDECGDFHAQLVLCRHV